MFQCNASGYTSTGKQEMNDALHILGNLIKPNTKHLCVKLRTAIFLAPPCLSSNSITILSCPYIHVIWTRPYHTVSPLTTET